MFLDPTGTPLPSFTIENDTKVKTHTELLQKTEDILYADMELERCIEGKQFHDVVGGYQRLDRKKEARILVQHESIQAISLAIFESLQISEKKGRRRNEASLLWPTKA